MVRSFLTLALSLFLLAEASAQTAPTPITQKTTAKSTKVAVRKARKARRVALKTVPATPLANDGWPPLEEQTTVASVATATNNGWEAAGPVASSRGEIDHANVYAAPGMPIHLRTTNAPVPYSVRPPRKPATSQTTLGN
jgi:hypothetical protein